MAYRGDDLDLRTPQAWGSSGRDTSGADQPNWFTRSTIYKGGRADPIWVDDHVMACCNHAFDLAVAHRAPEVRLEHLINALTLNEHAAHVLEQRGFSVASLRRESGASIANDIPAGAGNTVPKRSEGMEEALRLAADHAYPRRTPVTVDDLLHVLFELKRDTPGLQLLRRHATSWSGRNGADNGRPELRLDPLPHLSRPQPQSWQRYASQSAHDYFSQPAPSREPPPAPATREPTRDFAPREPSPRQPAPTPVDSFQDSRLDSLERAVRDLGVDLADDRKTLRSLVADIQRSSAAQADDTGRFQGGLSERLASLEDALARARSDASAMPSAVSAVMDRMGMIERAIDSRLADAASRPFGPSPALLDRLASIERIIDTRLADAASRPYGPSPALLDRLASIERSLEARIADMGRTTIAMNDRLQSLEQAASRPVEATLSPLVSQRLDAITQFATKVDAIEQTFQLILDRMTGLERRLSTMAETKPVLDTSAIENKLAALEQNLRASIEKSADMEPVTDLLAGVDQRIAGVERTLDNRAAETGRTVSFIGERLRSFEEAMGAGKTQTIDRVGQIERSLAAYAESVVAAGSSHENSLTEVHEAMLKLNANQQTLASSLDQWRLDNTGDLSVINNRLKAIEEADTRRTPQIENLTAQVATIHSALAKREVRKSRFQHWLFGTDEWYSASYDTKNWRSRQVPEPEQTPVKFAEAKSLAQRATPAAPPPSVR